MSDQLRTALDNTGASFGAVRREVSLRRATMVTNGPSRQWRVTDNSVAPSPPWEEYLVADVRPRLGYTALQHVSFDHNIAAQGACLERRFGR